ncbi:MAG: type IV pilus modification protein PilV [Gammaproteobacteria bacterium]
MDNGNYLNMIALHKSTGFTLTEVLVSLVVLSIGLLGLASVQTESLKKNNDAYLSSLASTQAADIIDRMRSNYQQAKSGGYTTSSPTSAGQTNLGCLGGIPNQPSTQGTSQSSSCTEQQMSLNDLYEWQANLANLLPDGKGRICLSSNPGAVGSPVNCNNQGDVYVIQISWRGRDGDTDEYRVAFKP